MTRRTRALVWGVVGVLAVAALWELYKFAGPAEGLIVGAVAGEPGSGVMILPRTHDRAMPHIWEMFARLGQSAPMILGGVAAGFLLYVVSVLVKAFGSSGFVPPPVAAWFPVVVAAFFGVTFLLHKEDG